MTKLGVKSVVPTYTRYRASGIITTHDFAPLHWNTFFIVIRVNEIGFFQTDTQSQNDRTSTEIGFQRLLGVTTITTIAQTTASNSCTCAG